MTETVSIEFEKRLARAVLGLLALWRLLRLIMPVFRAVLTLWRLYTAALTLFRAL